MRVPRRTRLFLGLVLSGILMSAAAAQAVTRTWTGLGADDNWTNGANWGGTGPSAGDDLVFPGGTPRLTPNNDFAANVSFNSISFTGATGGYTLVGNAIQLVAGISATNTAGNSIVQLGVTLAASQTFTCAIPSVVDRLTISGPVDVGTFTLTYDPTGAVINQNSVISGTGGVTLIGGGILFLVANATYTGPTNVTGGDFVLAGSSLAPASVVTVSGGLLQFANGASAGPVTATAGTVACEGGGTSQIGNVTDLTMQSGTTLLMQMFSAINYGQLNASGNVSLGGATLTLAFSFTSAMNDAFTIINNTGAGAVSGTFAGLPEGATFVNNTRTYQITYVGGTGNDVVITDITTGGATPTPTTTVGITATPTPPPATTPTPTTSPGPGATAVVPTLSPRLLAVLALALALAALFAIRRSG